MKTKVDSLEEILQQRKPHIVCLVETHLYGDKSKDIKIKGYKPVGTRERVDKGGGGILVLCKERLHKVMNYIPSTEDKELVWVKLSTSQVSIKVGVVYFPQESTTKLKEIKEIYQELSKEVKVGRRQKETVMIVGDFNCKIGNTLRGNSEEISKGGRQLLTWCKQQDMVILNKDERCKGLWTRKEGTSKSVLDYALIGDESSDQIIEMTVDEEKDLAPYCFQEGRKVYSDHNSLLITLNSKLEVERQKKSEKRVLTKKGIQKYRKMLQKRRISRIFLSKRSIEQKYNDWSEIVKEEWNNAKVKWKERKDRVEIKYEKTRRRLRRQLKLERNAKERQKLIAKIDTVNFKIRKWKKEKRYKHLIKTIDRVRANGGVNSGMFWEVIKELQPRRFEEKTPVYDKQGNRIEEKEQIIEVTREYYEELLQTSNAGSEIQQKKEEIIDIISKSVQKIANRQEVQNFTTAEVKRAMQQSKNKKAGDQDQWRNEMFKEGGEEMIEAVTNMFNEIQSKGELPSKWTQMKIKSIHKKGAKGILSNKRGLFLTNIMSKLFERVIKNRNEENLRKGIGNFQCGGVKGRGTIDHLMTILAIIERRRYLQQHTYIMFADLEKCFDKLWLGDSLNDIRRAGMKLKDVDLVRKMNEKAEIVVECPHGLSQPFLANHLVRQGTIYGPPLCGVSTKKVNEVGERLVTYYGPNIEIGALIYVDDISAAGSNETVEKAIGNCAFLEEDKKMTFNVETNKSGYMVVESGKKSERIREITTRVKKGPFKRVWEYDYLGVILNYLAEYYPNIIKSLKKINGITAKINEQCTGNTMGTLAMEGRLSLLDKVALPSVFHHAEAWATLTSKEIQKMEQAQSQMIKTILHAPKSTPYYGLLWETGILTIESRVKYKKMMLYHNIMNSEVDRLSRRILMFQKEEKRTGTWFMATKEIAEQCGQINTFDQVLQLSKDEWKKIWKETIWKKDEMSVRERAKGMTKMRTVEATAYGRKRLCQTA